MIRAVNDPRYFNHSSTIEALEYTKDSAGHFYKSKPTYSIIKQVKMAHHTLNM